MRNLNWGDFDVFSSTQSKEAEIPPSALDLFVILDVPEPINWNSISSTLQSSLSNPQSISSNSNTDNPTLQIQSSVSKADRITQFLKIQCPNLVFNPVQFLTPISISDFAQQGNQETQLLEPKFNGDLSKLQNLSNLKGGNLFIAAQGNWNFDAVRKLPWKLHNQGISPLFFNANRNLFWQSDNKSYQRFYEKGVVLPIDLISIIKWRSEEKPAWISWLQGSNPLSKQAKAALKLYEIQVDAPNYLLLSEMLLLSK
jgi:hypothetical protein